MRRALTESKTLVMFAYFATGMTLVFGLLTGQSWFEAILGGVVIGAFFAGGQAFARRRSWARRS